MLKGIIIKPIKKGFSILTNPKNEFQEIGKREFESIVGDYIKLLLIGGSIAGLFSFLYSLFKTFYFDIFLNTDIQYWRMINYNLSISISLLFLYIFVGTFILFIISLLIRPFFSKFKYVDLLTILMYSASPLLLFSWLLFNPIPLIIWSIFLFVIGVKSHKNVKIKKGSINQRD